MSDEIKPEALRRRFRIISGGLDLPEQLTALEDTTLTEYDLLGVRMNFQFHEAKIEAPFTETIDWNGKTVTIEWLPEKGKDDQDVLGNPSDDDFHFRF